MTRANELFVVLEGEVAVMRDGREVARIESGRFFGEISVLDGGPRTADVVAAAPSRCLAIPRDVVREALAPQPGRGLGDARDPREPPPPRLVHSGLVIDRCDLGTGRVYPLCMREERVTAIFKANDVSATIEWYSRLGFEGARTSPAGGPVLV